MNLIDQLEQNLEYSRSEKRTFESSKWKGILYPELSWQIVGAAIEVHKHIGAGQLESVLSCEEDEHDASPWRGHICPPADRTAPRP